MDKMQIVTLISFVIVIVLSFILGFKIACVGISMSIKKRPEEWVLKIMYYNQTGVWKKTVTKDDLRKALKKWRD